MNNIQKLILAVQFGNLETVKNLIENEKIDINTSTKVTIKSNTYNGFLDNTTALHEACRQLDYEIVAYLLKNGADVNIIAAVSPTDRQDGLIGWTVLHSLIVGYIFKQEEENAPANALEVLRLIKIKEIKDTNFLKYTIPVETGDSKAPQNYSIQSLLESFELTKKPISLKYFMKIMIPSCIRHIKSLKEKTEALAVNAEVPEDKEKTEALAVNAEVPEDKEKTEALAVNTEVPEDKEKTEALAVKAEVPEDEVKSNSTSSEKKLASPTFHPIVLDSLSNFIKMLQLLIQSYPKNQRPHTIRHFQSILDKKEYTKEEKIKAIATKAENSLSHSTPASLVNRFLYQRSANTEKLYRLITACFKLDSTNPQDITYKVRDYNKLIRHINCLISHNEPKKTSNLTYTPPTSGF